MAENATLGTPKPWRFGPLAALGVAVALSASPVRADPTEDLARLKQEAAQLRHSLDQLEAKIGALENRQGGRNVAPSATGPASNPGPEGSPANAPGSTAKSVATEVTSLAALRQNWSRVQPGTTDDAVQALLGKPERVLRIDGSPVWYYLYPGVGRGSVFFTLDGKVSSTQAPVGGSFW